MRHPSLDITDEQEANLRKLAAYLMTQVNPEQFDMSDYMNGHDNKYPRPILPTECGTVACAAGYGPSAGIRSGPDEEWAEYVGRAFCKDDSLIWEWCFSADWEDADDTPFGAASRILWMLEFGVPHDVQDMFDGAPLCYAGWTPEGYPST